jgi:alanyl-tRNA synthetase
LSLSSDDIRRIFIEYFAEHGHEHLPSSSLVPAEDPTLLFTNAGMNQFKSVFLGETPRTTARAVTSQKCMRVSGKHNDLETVGPSLYHHTFFEMLGNFSFGDYFKAEAIAMAWELFTERYGLEKERLWATVYEEDDEAEELWISETDLPAERVLRLGAADNYWSMGETGPCGPCSELHYDYEYDGSPVENPDMDSDRFVELWNLVFMQFNASADGSVVPLPSPNIDTGAGLERLTAVLQGTRSNYDTDLFQPIIVPVAEGQGLTYGEDDETDVALRVIADHSRALAFLLADGIMPSNDGRGYVLRRLLRRAMRFGMKLGYCGPFLHASAGNVVERMHGTYPELAEQRDVIDRVIRAEEERFLQTLSAGSQMFNDLAATLRESGETRIPGEEAFRLYDTFGLPIELTRDFAGAEGLTVDEEGFARALDAQRQRARAAWKGGAGEQLREKVRALMVDREPVEVSGYTNTATEGATVVALFADDERVDQLDPDTPGSVLVDRTPFYAESGGQVADVGEIVWRGGRAEVRDVQRPVAGAILHEVVVTDGTLEVGERVDLAVDAERRMRTRRNHTATHLLHAALRRQLGDHVRQAGSLVEPDRLRFDFTHYEGIDARRLSELEEEINRAIRGDVAVETEEMAFSQATDRGALAFFGEKYGDVVRVVSIPGVSMELCGGTHVGRTGEIGALVIQHEESVASGTRRIEAVTGDAALATMQHYRDLVRSAAARAKAPEEQLVESIERLAERAGSAEREAEQLRLKLASQAAASAADEATEVAGLRVLTREVEGLDAGGLRNLVDELKAKVGSGVVVLGMRAGGKAQLVVGVTSDVTDRVGAGDVVRALAPIVGGGGGGRPEMAQAGGPDASKVSDALQKAPKLIGDLLS